MSVPKLWAGETVVCMATGPSLTREDAEFVRGRARVIAINDAHRLAPWADVLYSSDRRWWPHYKGVPEFVGMKFGIGSAPGKANPFHAVQDVRVLRNTGYAGLETDPSGLRNGRNSGYAAINLAVHFGAARIVLLGYNLGTPGGQVHFFGNHPSGLTQAPGLYPGWRRTFETLVAPLAERGIEIINCTENTSLTAFPLGDLREVFARAEAAVA